MSIFEDGALRQKVFKKDGAKLVLRELRLVDRRQVLEAHQNEMPPEIIAALTVALSCPDLNENDIERLVQEVSPDILLAAAKEVYALSGMLEGAKTEAKKPCGSQSGGLSFGWLWRWALPPKS